MQRFISLLFILFVCLVSRALAASVATPTCGGTTSSKYIQLKNPTNPPRECNYHINAYSKTVCQLRIDFQMILAQPSLRSLNNELSSVECTTDYFRVNNLKLCGIETLQHIYVPFNRSAGITELDLQIVLAARAGATGLPDPFWHMKLTQLECTPGAAFSDAFDLEEEPTDIWTEIEIRKSSNDAFFIAPPGCLQYFPQRKGIFASFNFNQGHGIYPNSLNYAICFRRTIDTNNFKLLNHYFNLGARNEQLGLLNVDNNCYLTKDDPDEIEDYLMIPFAEVEKDDFRATFFCGKSLYDATIYSKNPGPLMLTFKSGSVTNRNEHGFAFSYKVLS